MNGIQIVVAPQLSDDLRCRFSSWTALGLTCLRLDVPLGNAPRMAGAVRLAKRILPAVNQIRVYEDGDLLIDYELKGKKWTPHYWHEGPRLYGVDGKRLPEKESLPHMLLSGSHG